MLTTSRRAQDNMSNETQTDLNQVAHDAYVEPRCQAMAGLREWPDKKGGFDLWVELSNPDRIVIMQRPFGTKLSMVNLESRMSMNVPEDASIDDIVPKMGSLLEEINRIIVVGNEVPPPDEPCNPEPRPKGNPHLRISCTTGSGPFNSWPSRAISTRKVT